MAVAYFSIAEGAFEYGHRNANKACMSIPPINNSYIQSILTSAMQGAGVTTNKASNVSQPSDNSQLSPIAQLMSTLQQLQQTDPAKYAQVTQQIATNLQTATQTATSSGNTAAATQLNQLASDFTSASKSGQLPNIQDLAQAIGGHHHGHHHHAHAAANSDGASSSSTSSTSSASTSQTLSQLLAGFQTGGSQNDALNPRSIILNTLSAAGIQY